MKTETLSSSLYLVISLLLRKDYDGVARMISSCSTDTPLSREEEWILGMVRLTVIAGPGIVVRLNSLKISLSVSYESLG